MTPHFEIYKDAAGEWRWRLLSGRLVIADSSEGYKTRWNVKRAIRNLARRIDQVSLP